MICSTDSLQGFSDALALQRETLKTFYRMAGEIAGEGCPLGPLPASLDTIERNFFSTFFLAITGRLVGPSRYMPLYAMVNQCMRAWVTACDNLLDDEYKEIFPFQMAGRGLRTRSVLTILLADRVLWEYIAQEYAGDGVLRAAGRLSLAALAPSALQECEEELRPVTVLPSRRLLADIHSRKTGSLFMAPLALPCLLERPDGVRAAWARCSVNDFGMACQCLDDIVDMPRDLAGGRHNLLISLACEASGGDNLALPSPSEGWTAWDRFRGPAARAAQIAMDYFASSFDAMERLGIALDDSTRGAVIDMICNLLRVPAAAVTRAAEKA